MTEVTGVGDVNHTLASRPSWPDQASHGARWPRWSRVLEPRSHLLALLLGCLGFDLLNHDGLRTASLIDLAACEHLVSSKRQKLRVLPARWRGVGDGPVNSSIVRENDEL